MKITVPSSLLKSLAVAAVIVTAAGLARADTLFWYADGENLGGDGTWTTSSGAQWSPTDDGSGPFGPWDQAGGQDVAYFSNAGLITITISGTVSANQITYDTTGSNNINFTGGTLNMTGDALFTRATGNNILMESDITGSNGITINTARFFSMNTVAKTYTGNTTIEGSSRLITNLENVLPSSTIVVVNTAGAGFDIRANQQIAGLAGTQNLAPVFRGTAGTSTLTLSRNDAGTSTFQGRFTQEAGTVNLVKTGNYTQEIIGGQASLSNGTVLIEGGVLALNKTAGVNALGSGAGAITITGGELRLNNHNQLADTQAMVLAGGTFNVNGRSEVLGTLSLTSNSDVQLGDLMDNEGALAFADSSSLDWSSFTLTINGLVDDTTLRFGTDAFGLTSAQLSQFRFADYDNLSGQIDSLGYITPVPEPSPGILIGLFGLAIFVLRRCFFIRAQ